MRVLSADRYLRAGLLVLCLACAPLRAADFEAGVATIRITPPTPFWLSGYAARTNPAPVVLQDLWAKALAIRDPQGHRVVLVTMDLIGLPREVADAVATQAKEQFKLERADLVLNCSHTHCGPTVGRNLSVMFDFDAAETRRVRQYADDLAGMLVHVTGEALRALSPAQLAVGQGSVNFAVNRRQPTPNGFRLGVNTNGPMDRTVPVLRVTAPDGRLRAVLFGYACHNTTLGGDIYEINGDYSGHAQAGFEQAHPGVTAMFMMLCGGDQNPHPRGTLDLARQHGRALADEVRRVLGTELRPVRPPIRTACETVQLDFAAHTREKFEAEEEGSDKYRRRRAALMLAAYDAGRPVCQTPYPVQAVRFNDDLTLLALAGEVVVDYDLRAKREFAGENLVVAGYCHEVMCYTPSKRVLLEGGYEPDSSMIYYGMPGPFAETVEERVFAGIRKVLQSVGAKPVLTVPSAE
jgi:hypothetical protein